MNEEKIAILIDSGVDVPSKLVKNYGMYVIPLKIIYKDREYSDGVDITAQEVYEKLDNLSQNITYPTKTAFNAVTKTAPAAAFLATLANG